MSAPARGRTVLYVGGSAVLAALLFAPVTATGWCAAAPVSGAASCDITSRSVVGIDTNVWVWVGATVALGALAWWLARRPRRER